jgi:hypothetical protein
MPAKPVPQEREPNQYGDRQDDECEPALPPAFSFDAICRTMIFHAE